MQRTFLAIRQDDNFPLLCRYAMLKGDSYGVSGFIDNAEVSVFAFASGIFFGILFSAEGFDQFNDDLAAFDDLVSGSRGLSGCMNGEAQG
jgi:hypothetical protein